VFFHKLPFEFLERKIAIANMLGETPINLCLIVFLLCQFVWIRESPRTAAARESFSISRELPG